jgi:L-alanine-DL-glutamate epimerase-like enolase superfamily enzyme
LRADLHETTLALRAPLRTANGELRSRPLLLLEVEGGWGEAVPLEPYDGVSLERCRAALETHLRILREADPTMLGVRLVEACRQADPLPQALAAVDLALWDRAGQRADRPLCELLTDAPAAFVHVNALADTATEAATAARAGFRCVKAKAGLGDDGERLAAIRAAIGPDVALRIDANGAWTVDEASRRLAELEPLDLELAEEPVHGVTELRALRDRVRVPLAMDETDAPGSGATELVCLKISRAGGISALLAKAAFCHAVGEEVYLASTLDGPLGIAAALHCAAALRIARPCGLATLDRLQGVDPGMLVPVDGMLEVPRAPGLGATPSGSAG